MKVVGAQVHFFPAGFSVVSLLADVYVNVMCTPSPSAPPTRCFQDPDVQFPPSALICAASPRMCLVETVHA